MWTGYGRTSDSPNPGVGGGICVPALVRSQILRAVTGPLIVGGLPKSPKAPVPWLVGGLVGDEVSMHA